MQTKHVTASSILVLILGLFVPYIAVSDDNVTLKDVMQGLNAGLQEATYGIVMEDYELIAKAARAIAEHPTPDKSILKKIVAHLGAEMPKFKGFDTQVHDTALELEKAAISQDKEAILSSHNQIINGCVSCHENYRQSISSLLQN